MENLSVETKFEICFQALMLKVTLLFDGFTLILTKWGLHSMMIISNPNAERVTPQIL